MTLESWPFQHFVKSWDMTERRSRNRKELGGQGKRTGSSRVSQKGRNEEERKEEMKEKMEENGIKVCVHISILQRSPAMLG